MNFLHTYFISPEGEKRLLTYKYSGCDKSPIYNYILSPFAQYCVDKFMPEWIAPNLITLVGFFFSLIPHLIFLFMYHNNMTANVPVWLLMIALICHMLYINCDNMDGKQARKTGNSSPLGLLFDHGCDSMNTWITGIIIMTVFQFGNTCYSIYGYMILMIPFFTATWEEYYVNGLYFPCISAATEGTLIPIVIYIISAIAGCDLWSKNVSQNFQVYELIFYLFVASTVIVVLMNVKNVYNKIGVKVFKALLNLLSLSYICISMIIVIYFSKYNIVEKMPKVLIYFAGFTFSKLVGHLQAAHCAKEEFNQFRKSLWISCTFLNINTLLGYFTNQQYNLDEQIVMYCLMIFSIIADLHFIFNIIYQFTTVLGIHCFKVKSKSIEIGNAMKKSLQ